MSDDTETLDFIALSCRSSSACAAFTNLEARSEVYGRNRWQCAYEIKLHLVSPATPVTVPDGNAWVFVENARVDVSLALLSMYFSAIRARWLWACVRTLLKHERFPAIARCHRKTYVWVYSPARAFAPANRRPQCTSWAGMQVHIQSSLVFTVNQF